MVNSSIYAFNDKQYNIPNGIYEKKFIALIKEFADLAIEKGLTVRQAQELFECCKDYVLDYNLSTHSDFNTSKISEKYSVVNSLNSIADSLSKISTKGVDIFERCITTNET